MSFKPCTEKIKKKKIKICSILGRIRIQTRIRNTDFNCHLNLGLNKAPTTQKYEDKRITISLRHTLSNIVAPC